MGRQLRKHYKANRHDLEVVLGPSTHRESLRVRLLANDEVGRLMLKHFRQVFIVPDIPGLEHKFALACDIIDSLWSRAYLTNGCIDDNAFEESIQMQIAYLRSILPEELPCVRAEKLSDEPRSAPHSARTRYSLAERRE
jgi:hypothetical protein